MSKIQLKKETDKEIVSNVAKLQDGVQNLYFQPGLFNSLNAAQKSEMMNDTLAMMASQYEVTIPKHKAIEDMDIKQGVVMENKTAQKRQTRSHMWGSALRTKRLNAEALKGLAEDASVMAVGFADMSVSMAMVKDAKNAARALADEIGVLASMDMKFKLDSDSDFIKAAPRLTHLKKQLDTVTRIEKCRPEAMDYIPQEVKQIYQAAKLNASKLVNYYEARKAVITDEYYQTHYQNEISYSYNESDNEAVRALSIKLWALEAARDQLDSSISVPRGHISLADVSVALTEEKRAQANEFLGTAVTMNETVDIAPLTDTSTAEEKKELNQRALAFSIRVQTIGNSLATPPGLCGAELLCAPLWELTANASALAQKYQDLKWAVETYFNYKKAGAEIMENTATASNIDGMMTFMAVYEIIEKNLREFANGSGSYANCKRAMIEDVAELENGAQIIENISAGYRSTMFTEEGTVKTDAQILQSDAKERIDYNASGAGITSGVVRMADKKAAIVQYIDSLQHGSAMFTAEYWTLIDAYREYFTAKEESEIADALKKLTEKKNELMEGLSGAEEAALAEIEARFSEMDSTRLGTMEIPADAKIMNAANPATRFGAVYVSQKDRALFPAEPTLTDIQQRTVSDCYLLSTLSGVAHADPQKIMSMMKDEGDTVVVGFVVDDQRIQLHEEDGSVFDTYTKSGAAAVLYRMISMMASSDYIVESQLLKDRFRAGEEGDYDGFEIIEESREEMLLSALYKCLYTNNPEYMQAKIDILFNDREFGLNKLALANQIDGIMRSDESEEDKLDAIRVIVDGVLSSIVTTFEDENLDALMRRKLRPEVEEDASGAECQRHLQKMEYVRVSKDIPEFGGMVDAYASGPLWAQLYEKAYVAKFGTAEGYDSIKYRNASEALRHIYGIGYDSRDESGLGMEKNILARFDSPADYVFREHGRPDGTLHIMEANMLQNVIEQVRKEMKEGYPSIERVLSSVSAMAYHALDMSSEQEAEFAEFLSSHYRLQHEAFSGKYTSAAISVMVELGHRLAQGQTVIVGCNFATRDGIDGAEQQEIYRNHEATGIRNEHAYTVVDVFENAQGKFVKVRDPYARFVRKYEHSTDEDGNPVHKAVADTSHTLARQADNGVFDMELNDFLRTFNEFSGLKVR